jgi:O-antigen ligase
MGTGLGLLIVLGMTLRGHWRPLALGGMVCGAAVLAMARMDSMVRLERDNSAAAAADSVGLRGSFAYISWKMFLDRPLWGVGFGQFPDAKLPYLSDRETSLHLEGARPYTHHNTLLSVLTETGLIGVAAFMALLIAWGRTAWKLARHADAPDWARVQGILFLGALGVYLCQAVFHELSYTPATHALLFLLAGATVGLYQAAAAPQPAAAWASDRGLSLVGRRSTTPT